MGARTVKYDGSDRNFDGNETTIEELRDSHTTITTNACSTPVPPRKQETKEHRPEEQTKK